MQQGVFRAMPISIQHWRIKLRQLFANYLAYLDRHPIDHFWPPHP